MTSQIQFRPSIKRASKYCSQRKVIFINLFRKWRIQESRPGASFTTVGSLSFETNVNSPNSQLAAAKQTVKTKHLKTDTKNISDTKRSVGEGLHVFTGMIKLKIILIITRYLRMRMKH